MNYGLLVGYLSLCFVIGALPLIRVLTILVSGKNLSQLGTRNISVSAAFYHAGTVTGIFAVLIEAGKGAAVVLLAHHWFPNASSLPLLGLMGLVLGRFALAKGAGTTNVVWGVIAYNWRIAFTIFVLSCVLFIVQRDRNVAKYAILFLLPLVIAVQTQHLNQSIIAIGLALVLGWIYTQIPDDLALPNHQAKNKAMFDFLTGSPPNSLDENLDANKVGQKAANLSQLKRWGYAVPAGWVLLPGDDPEAFARQFTPTPEDPVVVRSTAVGEDTLTASAAGQYDSVLNVTSQPLLWDAIALCQDSFDHPNAVHYRQTHDIQDAALAVLVQPQIQGVYSGVAFSRDPLETGLDQVVIEWLPGQAAQIVSGKQTPYRVTVQYPRRTETSEPSIQWENRSLSANQDLISDALLTELAELVRDLEARFHGIPQDVEWTFDGNTLWILQSRPITTLLPLWTRKIASEVIPGVIHPLTWSINQPMTCKVWGDLFQVVLGTQQSQNLDFQSTAALHYGRAYFNASLLGEIFIRMGLPPESLEFLTYDAPMSPPKGKALLKSVPGLVRLLGQEFSVPKTFRKNHQAQIQALLQEFEDLKSDTLAVADLLERIQLIRTALTTMTYFQIMVPLSVGLRQKLFRVPESVLSATPVPELKAMKTLEQLAQDLRLTLETTQEGSLPLDTNDLIAELQQHRTLKLRLDQFFQDYGYLSEVATDIAVPTWKENPTFIYQTLLGFVTQNNSLKPSPSKSATFSLGSKSVRKRLELKGTVAQLYNRLLAHLRWTILALEHQWVESHYLKETGDIFFLEIDEIESFLRSEDLRDAHQLQQQINTRKAEFNQSLALEEVPPVVYGQATPFPILSALDGHDTDTVLNGIGASAGQAEGKIQLVQSLRDLPPQINQAMILVVPFTDAGWAPIFSQAGGIISEVGGRLSHGAIMAREYGIPAVMDVSRATKRLQNGQKVRINGWSGVVELL